MTTWQMLARLIVHGSIEIDTPIDAQRCLRTIIFRDGDRHVQLPRTPFEPHYLTEHLQQVDSRQKDILGRFDRLRQGVNALSTLAGFGMLLFSSHFAQALSHYVFAVIGSLTIGVLLREALVLTCRHYLNKWAEA